MIILALNNFFYFSTNAGDLELKKNHILRLIYLKRNIYYCVIVLLAVIRSLLESYIFMDKLLSVTEIQN